MTKHFEQQPSEQDIEDMFAGLEADLANPQRIKVDTMINRINGQIEELIHRQAFETESYQKSNIREQISMLNEKKTELMKSSTEEASQN